MKKYFKVKGLVDEIKVSTGYTLGGWNHFTGKSDGRGYYLYVQPVQRSERSESFTMFDGFKVFLFPVDRKSKKMEAAAEQACEERAYELALQLARQKGWELEEVA